MLYLFYVIKAGVKTAISFVLILSLDGSDILGIKMSNLIFAKKYLLPRLKIIINNVLHFFIFI